MTTNSNSQDSSAQDSPDQKSTDRIATGRTVYARNLALTEVEAEALMTQRAGAQYTTEAVLTAGGARLEQYGPDRT